MLDVVHYYFETDAVGEKEGQDAKVKLRRILYGQLYQRPYTWGEESGADTAFGSQEVASGDYVAGGAPELTHKPYIPPTPVNADSVKPFGAALDAPLG
jgi:hypothetical protein